MNIWPLRNVHILYKSIKIVVKKEKNGLKGCMSIVWLLVATLHVGMTRKQDILWQLRSVDPTSINYLRWVKISFTHQ